MFEKEISPRTKTPIRLVHPEPSQPLEQITVERVVYKTDDKEIKRLMELNNMHEEIRRQQEADLERLRKRIEAAQNIRNITSSTFAKIKINF